MSQEVVNYPDLWLACPWKSPSAVGTQLVHRSDYSMSDTFFPIYYSSMWKYLLDCQIKIIVAYYSAICKRRRTWWYSLNLGNITAILMKIIAIFILNLTCIPLKNVVLNEFCLWSWIYISPANFTRSEPEHFTQLCCQVLSVGNQFTSGLQEVSA